jgi:hypothetical protein
MCTFELRLTEGTDVQVRRYEGTESAASRLLKESCHIVMKGTSSRFFVDNRKELNTEVT